MISDPTKKKFPSSIVILGQRFRIELVDKVDEEGSEGEMVGQYHRIRLDRGLDEARRWSSLWHEGAHGALHVTGLGNKLDDVTEEVIVQSLEYYNKQFMLQYGDEYLAAVRKDGK